MAITESVDGRYWGPFAAVREMPGLDLVEATPYEGATAHMMDLLTALDDVPGHLELAARYGDPVLELACGDGRILLELADRGHHVVGVDSSSTMLAGLRERLAKRGSARPENVETVLADITDLHLDRRFPLVLLGGISMVIFPKPVRMRIMAAAARHLAPGGVVAFDFARFSPVGAAALDGHVVERRLDIDGAPATAYFGARFDADGRRLVGNAYYQVRGTGDTVRHHLEAQELLLLDDGELDELLESAGLVLSQVTSTPLPSGIGERLLVQARSRRGLDYPLWHPHVPMADLPDAVTMLVSGDGCTVRTARGRELIDASGGLWSTQCGLGHPDIIEAVRAQLTRLSYGTLFAARSNEPALALARELVDLAPGPLPWCYLTNSGSESVELGIKLARLHARLRGEPERSSIVYLDESYHGTFFGSMGVSGLSPQKDAFEPGLPGLRPAPTPSPRRCPPGTSQLDFAMECAAALDRLLAESPGGVAGVILEPVLGSAGVVVPPREYLQAVQRSCREHGALFIVDEVATGFGRTGRWFAVEHFDLSPDVLLLSKGITSGYLPLGAVLFSGRVGTAMLEAGVGIGHGSSHNGNPACCAAALETIAVMRREGLVDRAAAVGAHFRERLEDLRRHSVVRDVRSLGLMLAIDVHVEADGAAVPHAGALLYSMVQEEGVLAYPSPAGVAFLPALVISREQVDAVVDATDRALTRLGAIAGGS